MVGAVKSVVETAVDFAVPERTCYSVKEKEVDPQTSKETETKVYGTQVPSSSYA